MAGGGRTHTILWRDVQAVGNADPKKGSPLREPARLNEGGPFNIALMDTVRAYGDALLRQSEGAKRLARGALVRRFDRQGAEGFMSKDGPGGGQCEQMTPFPHSTFYVGPILVALDLAARYEHADVTARLQEWLGSYMAIGQRFECRDRCWLPAARAKNRDKTIIRAASGVFYKAKDPRWAEKVDGQPGDPRSQSDTENQGIQAWLEDLLAYARGRRPAPALARLNIEAGFPRPVAEMLLEKAKVPKLKLPIFRADLGDGAFQAWFEPTDEARAQLNVDALNAVRAFPDRPDEPDLIYDWVPMPELPSGAKVEVFGAE